MRAGPRRASSRITARLFASVLLFFAVAIASFVPEAQAGGPPLRVGVTGKYPPFNYFDEGGKLRGFDVEVAEAICAELDRPCAFVPTPWDGILASLLAGKIDVVVGSMAITEARAKEVLFSRPYYESGAQLFVRQGSGRAREGLRVGVTLGTTYEAFVRREMPRAEVRTYKGEVEILQDLEAGRLDAMVTDKLVGAHMQKRFGAKLELEGPPLFVERIAIPVHPERRALLAEIDRAIAKLRASSRYAELFEAYFGLSASEAGSGPGGEREARAPGFAWSSALSLMLRGLAATAKVALLGVGLGCLLGAAVASLLVGAPSLARRILVSLVDFVRATPFLVQLFAIYFGLPAIGVAIEPFPAAVLAIALHSAAYLAEVLKTAYLAVPSGQHQAATSLGLTRAERLLHVVFPQMLPAATAPALNTVVAMIKDSAVVSVISVYELTMQTQQLVSASFRPLELYAAAALLYFALTYPLLLAGRGLERRYRAQGLIR